MATVEIPLTADVEHYEFSIELEAVLFFLEIRFNKRMNIWSMDLLDADKIPLLVGLLLLKDTDLIGRFSDERLPPGTLTFFDTLESSDPIEKEELGDRLKLLYEETI